MYMGIVVELMGNVGFHFLRGVANYFVYGPGKSIGPILGVYQPFVIESPRCKTNQIVQAQASLSS